MRLTILSSVSVLAVLCLAPVQAFSAFEFVAPRTPQAPASVNAVQAAAPAVSSPVVETSNLPLPAAQNSAADLVKNAINPVMNTSQQGVDFGHEAVPLTPAIPRSDALVVDTGRATISQDLPPLPPVGSAVPVIPAPVMPLAPNDSIPSISAFEAPINTGSNFGNNAADGEVVQGFGRDVPLVLALQQIVPPSYRYSFDDGISPGMTISWSGGQPWKNVIMEIAQHNNLNVDIVSNVVAFHRGGGSSGTMASDAMPSAIMPLAPIAAPIAAPVAQPIITERKVIASTLSSPAPAPVDFDRVTARPLAQNSAQQAIKPAPVQEIAVASNNRSFDALLGNDDVPASGRVANKQILTADASTAVKVTDSILAESSSFDIPMPIAPMASANYSEDYQESYSATDRIMADHIVRRSSSDTLPVAAPTIASAPSYMEADMTSGREWNAFKGETLRQALTNWSNNAGVSLVWSSEYDYPLQTDVRIAGDYTGAVRTLLAGFSRAQPRPLGRLFDNQETGAQPVLIVETQRLTN